MNSIQKRFAMFLGACIPIRLLIVFVAKKTPVNYLQYLGYIALLPAFGFLYLYFTGGRQKGLETLGQPIWWSKFRIIHGLLYLLFAIYAINKISFAYIFLAIDVILGLILFLWHHYISGNFTKLIV